MAHPDFDTPENHLAREPFPAPDTTCSDCGGTGLLSDPVEPCIYCDGTGYREPRRMSREQLRALEAALVAISRGAA